MRCGHTKPVWEEACTVCRAVDRICRKHKRDQTRINLGKPLGTLGARIAAGNA